MMLRIMIHLMRSRINSILSELNFARVEEDLSFDKQNALELSFNFIVDTIWRRHRENIDSESRINKIFDIFLVFLTLCIITTCILSIPLYLAPDPLSAKITSIIQLFIVLLIASICWGGVVYLSQEFRHICQKKFVVEVKGSEKNNFLIAFFNGFYFENPSGRGFRVYLRSIFLVFLMCGTEYVQLHQTYAGQVVLASFNLVFINHNFLYFPVFAYSLISQFVIFLTVFIIFFSAFTVILIFLFLLSAGLFWPLKINPFVDMGGTGEYGKIVVNCIYLMSVSIGVFPVLEVINEINFGKIILIIQSAKDTLGITNDSWTNVTLMANEALSKSTHEIITDIANSGKFYQIITFFGIFIGFVLFSIVILLVFHFQINKRKNEELEKIDEMLAEINVYDSNNQIISNRIQHLLLLHQKLLSTSEWPVKKIFLIDVIISSFLLFIPKLLGL